jgi:hypothetical protein
VPKLLTTRQFLKYRAGQKALIASSNVNRAYGSSEFGVSLGSTLHKLISTAAFADNTAVLSVNQIIVVRA